MFPWAMLKERNSFEWMSEKENWKTFKNTLEIDKLFFFSVLLYDVLVIVIQLS